MRRANGHGGDRYWTIAQLAKRWQVHQNTVRNWIKRGHLAVLYTPSASKYGRKIRVAQDEVDRFEARFRAAPEEIQSPPIASQRDPAHRTSQGES